MKENDSDPTMVELWVEKQSINKRHNKQQRQCVYEISNDTSPSNDDYFH